MTDQIETLMALADSFAEYRDHNEYVHTRAKLRKALEAALKPVDNEMHREVIAAIGAAGLTLVRAVNGFRLVRLGEITAQAAPPAQTPVEPAMNGWKLVPVEPTDEMLLATIATAGNYTKEQMLAWPEVSETRTNWAAMLDAAPPAQTPPPRLTDAELDAMNNIELEKLDYEVFEVNQQSVKDSFRAVETAVRKQ